jgi:hypothetical protein
MRERLTRRSRGASVLLGVAFLLVIAAALGAGVGGGALLSLAPALLLIACLLVRLYPGERVLVALAQRRSPRSRRRAAGSPSRRRPLETRTPRGGLLIGFALASRPPPAALAS